MREAAAKAHRATLRGGSLIPDKCSSPDEPATPAQEQLEGVRPLGLVARESSKNASLAHESHGNVLASYAWLEVAPSLELEDLLQPQYLGTTHPFTLPIAVGGYDIRG